MVLTATPIEYYAETKDGEDKQLIVQAQLDIDGKRWRTG